MGRRWYRWLGPIAGGVVLSACDGSAPPQRNAAAVDAIVGSASCRECHAELHDKWATSHHGLAMQQFTPELAASELPAPAEPAAIGGRRYRFDGVRSVVEEDDDRTRELPVEWVLGGKNVYYLLTPAERGRLQVLPVGYDVRRREWFDVAASGVRHPVEPDAGEALEWTDPRFTFNTSCHDCHVSQLSTNYDAATDSYRTTWTEPGINCETCHGPGAEHVRLCREAPEGRPPEELAIVRIGDLRTERRNDLCAPCHAKMIPLTGSFRPGDRFLDHFAPSLLDDPDFHPDGRDLGENYTWTSWRMSPCAASGELDCLHCHTSSGRYRFGGERADDACLPCHRGHVESAAEHSFHEAGSAGSRCVSCHMPTTEFARMRRTDHSMLPPTPAVTAELGSPNACNACHGDRDAAWADAEVRRRRERDYQAPVLERARLVDAARRGDWSLLEETLAWIRHGTGDEVTRATLVRLLGGCDADARWPALIESLRDPSPLVRAAAAEALAVDPPPESVPALLAVTGDDVRLVRVRAAAALAALAPESLPEGDGGRLSAALAELESSLRVRPDDPWSHYNRGNLQLERGQTEEAVRSFEAAVRLRPDSVPPRVNAAIAYGLLGRTAEAERSLRAALELEPANAAALLDLGLLLGETGRADEAVVALRAAFAADTASAVAAYNLAVLLAGRDPTRALEWSRRAAELRPEEEKYAYTLAYYSWKSGDRAGALSALDELLARRPGHADALALRRHILGQQE